MSIMSGRPGYYKQAPLSRARHVTWQNEVSGSKVKAMRRHVQTQNTLSGIQRAIQSNVRTNELLTDTIRQFSPQQTDLAVSGGLARVVRPPKKSSVDESKLSQFAGLTPARPAHAVLVPATPPPTTKSEAPRSSDERRAILRRDLRLGAQLVLKNGSRSYLTREAITWCDHPDVLSQSPSELESIFREWLPLRKVGVLQQHHVRDMDHRGVSDAEFYERIREGWMLHVNTRTLYPPDYEPPHQARSSISRGLSASLSSA